MRIAKLRRWRVTAAPLLCVPNITEIKRSAVLNGDTPTANQEGGKPMKPNHIALIVYAVGRPISIYF